MADGFTLEIDAELAESLERRAAECGLSREAFARLALEQQAFRYEDYRWTNGDPRQPDAAGVAEDGPDVPWERVRSWILSWGSDKELPEPR